MDGRPFGQKCRHARRDEMGFLLELRLAQRGRVF